MSKFAEKLRIALAEEILRDKKNTIPKDKLLLMSELQLKNELDKLVVGGLR